MEKGLITSQITEGEIIENKYTLNDNWDIWLLTNKRIIRYKTGTESIFEDLDYKHIVSIRLVEIGHLWLLIFGIPALLIGLYLLSYNRTMEITLTILTIIGIFFIIVGIILIFAAFLKDRKCEIIAHGTKWITNGNPRELTRNIRSHLSPFSLPLTSLSGIMTKEEEKMFCSNCGGEISIDFKFCKSCGNKLK